MNTFDKNMEQIFDVTSTQVIEKKQENLPVVPAGEPDLKQDLSDAYSRSKDNLEEIIVNGKEAMEVLLDIAKAGQHPRAFEVYSGMLKNMVDANKELLAMQKQMREMDGKKQETQKTNIDKAIFFNGSTADLQKLLKNKD